MLTPSAHTIVPIRSHTLEMQKDLISINSWSTLPAAPFTFSNEGHSSALSDEGDLMALMAAMDQGRDCFQVGHGAADSIELQIQLLNSQLESLQLQQQEQQEQTLLAMQHQMCQPQMVYNPASVFQNTMTGQNVSLDYVPQFQSSVYYQRMMPSIRAPQAYGSPQTQIIPRHSEGSSASAGSNLGQFTSLVASLAAASPAPTNSHPQGMAAPAGFCLSCPSNITPRYQGGPYARRSLGDTPSVKKKNSDGAFCRFPMTRGARKQVNQTLDEFWGVFYNLHGQPMYRPGPVYQQGKATAAAVSAGLQGHELYMAVKSCIKAVFAVEGALSLLDDKLGCEGLCPGMLHHSAMVAGMLQEEGDVVVLQLCATDAGGMHEVYVNAGSCSQVVDWEVVGAASLLSFGVWCIAKLLMLCQAETRPELWGKFAYALNKLQGFLKESTLERLESHMGDGSVAVKRVGLSQSHLSQLRQDIAMLLSLLECSLVDKKGPAGTAAGEVAFPKGKEIMQSLIKRYRRKLGISESPRSSSGAQQFQHLPHGASCRR